MKVGRRYEFFPNSTQKCDNMLHLLQKRKKHRKFLVSGKMLSTSVSLWFSSTSCPQDCEEIFFICMYTYTHTLTILLISPNPSRRIFYMQFLQFPDKLSIVTLSTNNSYIWGVFTPFLICTIECHSQSSKVFLITQVKNVRFFTCNGDKKSCKNCSSVQETIHCISQLTLAWYE